MVSSSFSNQNEQEDVTPIMDNDSLDGRLSVMETSEAIRRSLEGKIMIDEYLKNFFWDFDLVRPNIKKLIHFITNRSFKSKCTL